MSSIERKELTALQLSTFLEEAEDSYANCDTKVLYRYQDDAENELAQFSDFYIVKTQKPDGSVERKLVFVLP